MQILIRWLKMARLVNNISIAMATNLETAIDPRADKIFDEMDIDKSGGASAQHAPCGLHGCNVQGFLTAVGSQSMSSNESPLRSL